MKFYEDEPEPRCPFCKAYVGEDSIKCLICGVTLQEDDPYADADRKYEEARDERIMGYDD